MRKKKERVRPMPTEEEKAKAKLKAAGADPLVWAMKSVDEKFPDERAKDAETEAAEAAVVEETVEEDFNNAPNDNVADGANVEIKAEGATTMPTDEGVVTMEVKPMRQDVSDVKPEEVKSTKDAEADLKETVEKKDTAGKKGIAGKSIAVKGVAGKKAEKKDTTSAPKGSVKVASMESQQKKFIIAFAVLVLLALGGMGFGIAMMVRQNHATEELVAQIATSSAVESGVDDEYIYLKDWNMKIHLADGLTSVSYDYEVDDFASVMIWGAKKMGGANYTPDFAKQSKNGNPMGTVVRVPRYERSAAGRLIWYDDYYNYYYQGPSGEPEISESEMEWWVESYLLIKEMLTNADNYVKIDDGTISQQ